MRYFFGQMAGIFFCFSATAQSTSGATIILKIINEDNSPLSGSTVELLRSQDDFPMTVIYRFGVIG